MPEDTEKKLEEMLQLIAWKLEQPEPARQKLNWLEAQIALFRDYESFAKKQR